jgi:hypothetical protein
MRPVRHVRRRLLSVFGSLLIVAGLLPVAAVAPAAADTAAQPLPFSQNWANTGLITVSNDWSGVPGVIGYRGDGLASTGADPQTVTADGSATPVNVIANQTNTNLNTGGIAEFHLTDPVVALQGSGTADAPHLVLSVDTTADSGITVAYSLRDIDGSNTDNAVQQVALQYRVGSSGDYTNLPVGYVADATTGPSQATLVTPVSVILPAAADNQPLVQIRIITADAAGSDEWVGIDDISITTGGIAQDDAPTVTTTTPAGGASDVAVDSNITINFSEPVTVVGAWFTISCASSGAHTAAVSGGGATYTLDPDTDFEMSESCTVTIDDAGVHDVDADDPPDTMAADHAFTFTTTLPLTQIGQVQGAAHLSPFQGQLVKVEGVVTAKRSNGYYMQDPSPDADPATSEGIFVFTSSAPTSINVGDSVRVSGRVSEFRPGGAASTNLTITELVSPTTTVLSGGNPLPPTTVVGSGGRVPPVTVIEDDAAGSVETSGVFDPSTDGIDFYETLEHMRLQVNNAVAVGPENRFGEIFVLSDNGSGASVRTVRGGVLVRDVDPAPVGDYQTGDFNPERIQLDDAIVPGSTPAVNVGDHFSGPAVGVLDYDFGNFELNLTSVLTTVSGGLEREVTRAPRDQEIVVGTYNVENLDPTDGSFARHADLIVNHLRSPDVIAIEEIQDNDGAANTAVTDASDSWNMLIAAIQAAGGPVYEFRQIDPVDDQDGGQPGGNIRVGFLFRSDRGVEFIDRPGGDSVTPTTVVNHPSGPRLSFSPGRVDPLNPAYDDSRKPLAGEFRMHGKKVFVIALHLSSKGGDQPLFGRFQPPTRSSEVARHAQAQSVNHFVDQILAADPAANVIVLGDVNDFDFSETVQILEGGVLTTLMDTLPPAERYSYVFEGNSQVLDQILVSNNLLGFPLEYDPVHVNAEFADQASDHDPQVVRLDLRGRPRR